MRFEGKLCVNKVMHHANCIISQRHFFVSKHAGKNLFEIGKRLHDEQRYEEAAHSLAKAALLDHGPSYALLSSILVHNLLGGPKYRKRAYAFASAGAALGCKHSKGALSRCLLFSDGVGRNIPSALMLAMESAEAGSSYGQFALGWCYSMGWGVAQDDVEGVRLWRLAAAQGNVTARIFLDPKCVGGRGIVQDYAEAVRWYRLASAQGNADA